MATRALIIGGTGGLGQELAKLCREQDMVPTITGRARIEDPDEALLRRRAILVWILAGLHLSSRQLTKLPIWTTNTIG